MKLLTTFYHLSKFRKCLCFILGNFYDTWLQQFLNLAQEQNEDDNDNEDDVADDDEEGDDEKQTLRQTNRQSCSQETKNKLLSSPI